MKAKAVFEKIIKINKPLIRLIKMTEDTIMSEMKKGHHYRSTGH